MWNFYQFIYHILNWADHEARRTVTIVEQSALLSGRPWDTQETEEEQGRDGGTT